MVGPRMEILDRREAKMIPIVQIRIFVLIPLFMSCLSLVVHCGNMSQYLAQCDVLTWDILPSSPGDSIIYNIKNSSKVFPQNDTDLISVKPALFPFPAVRYLYLGLGFMQPGSSQPANMIKSENGKFLGNYTERQRETVGRAHMWDAVRL